MNMWLRVMNDLISGYYLGHMTKKKDPFLFVFYPCSASCPGRVHFSGVSHKTTLPSKSFSSHATDVSSLQWYLDGLNESAVGVAWLISPSSCLGVADSEDCR